jgi:hypothetical protein
MKEKMGMSKLYTEKGLNTDILPLLVSTRNISPTRNVSVPKKSMALSTPTVFTPGETH